MKELITGFIFLAFMGWYSGIITFNSDDTPKFYTEPCDWCEDRPNANTGCSQLRIDKGLCEGLTK